MMWSIRQDGLVIGWIDGRGPGSGVWPFWLSLGMALTSVWTIIRWYLGQTPESHNEAPYVDPESMGLVLVSFVALTVMLFLVGIIGTYLAVAAFMVFYMRFVGGHRLGLSITMAIGSMVFIYFLFEWQLSKYLPKGLPFFEEIFLWLDNYRWEYLM